MSLEYAGNKNEIKVSVIIPIYNMGKYLPCCLESILCQTLSEIEIIAINDGSTDNSLSILKEYQKHTSNLYIINQENQGSGSARNQGIIYSTGKYIAFMDPDDFYASEDCLETLYLVAERENVSMCGGKIINKNDIELMQPLENYFNAEKKVYNGNLIYVKNYSEIYGYTRFIFSSDLIKKNDIKFPKYRRFQDPIFFVKVLIKLSVFYEIDKEIYVYRKGHKKIKASYEICKDIVFGIKDLFQIVVENNLKNIYINSLLNLVEENGSYFYKYAFKGIKEFDDAINKINEIRLKQGFIADKNILTRESIYRNIANAKEEYIKVANILKNGSPILLYGAGYYTSLFLEIFYKSTDNILGIAVTDIKKNEEKKFGKIEIRQINEYKDICDKVYVLITTATCYHNEIKSLLKKMGFQHTICINMSQLVLFNNLI